MRISHLALFAVLIVAAPLLAGCGGSDDTYYRPPTPTDDPPEVVLTAPTGAETLALSLIHISEPTRRATISRMPSSA